MANELGNFDGENQRNQYLMKLNSVVSAERQKHQTTREDFDRPQSRKQSFVRNINGTQRRQLSSDLALYKGHMQKEKNMAFSDKLKRAMPAANVIPEKLGAKLPGILGYVAKGKFKHDRLVKELQSV